MADNVNIIVQDTINDIVVNAAVVVETIDINVQAAVDVVDIVANPNNYVVNINRIIGEQVQSDWDQTDNQAPDYIKNKPTIPAAQVNSDWDAITGVAEILNKPTIPTATSDLINDGSDGINPFITAADIPPVTGFVPYTGATEDVDLGEFEIKAGQVTLDTSPTGTAGVGVMRWNDTDGTVDLGLKGGNVTLQIGQEQVVRVVNKSGGNLLEANYQCVRIRTQAEGGAQGQRLAVKLAQANTKANHSGILGLVTETINNNQEGFITTFGNVSNIDTTGSLQGQTWLDGDVIWLSETVAGGLTNIEPTTHPVQIGYVVYAHQNNGKIFVSVSQGVDQLDELHDVSITSVANNDGLFYDSATTTWKNKTIATALGYTPFQLPALTSGSVLFSNGTTIAQDNSNLFWDDTNNRLGIGTNNPSAYYAKKLVVACPDEDGITILANTVSSTNYLAFADGVTGNEAYRGYVSYKHLTDQLTFGAAGSLRMTLTSGGNLLLNTTTDAGYKLDVNGTARVSGAMTITPATLTGSTATSALDISQTWNTTGTPTAIKLNITNTASNASSTLVSLQSNSNNIFRILNTGQVYLGSNNNIGFWVNDDGTNTPLISGRTLVISHSLSTQSQNGIVFRGANSLSATSGTQTLGNFLSNFTPTSGNAIFNSLLLQPTINQTGGASGITRGLYINPTLTSAADFRAIEVANGITILGASTTAKASLRIPSGTAPTTPTNGDIWFDGTNLKMQIGGVTKTFTLL